MHVAPDLKDQPGLYRQGGQRIEHGAPGNRALAGVPVTVGIGVGILQMHMAKPRSGGSDEIDYRWRIVAPMGQVCVAGIQ